MSPSKWKEGLFKREHNKNILLPYTIYTWCSKFQLLLTETNTVLHLDFKTVKLPNDYFSRRSFYSPQMFWQ